MNIRVFCCEWRKYYHVCFTKLWGGKIILGWVTFLGYVTLPSQGNFTETDVVYPACVWLPSIVNVVKIVFALKQDGVGPVDNRPFTISSTQKKCDT